MTTLTLQMFGQKHRHHILDTFPPFLSVSPPIHQQIPLCFLPSECLTPRLPSFWNPLLSYFSGSSLQLPLPPLAPQGLFISRQASAHVTSLLRSHRMALQLRRAHSITMPAGPSSTGPSCGRESPVFSVQPRPSLGLSHWLLCTTGLPSLFFPIFLPRAAQRAPRWRGLCKISPCLPISTARPLPCLFFSMAFITFWILCVLLFVTVSTTVELPGGWAGLLHTPRAFNSMWHSGAPIMNE